MDERLKVAFDFCGKRKSEMRRERIEARRLEKEKAKPRRVYDRNGFVYLVRCGDFVKIGSARNVKHCVGGLQSGNPHEIVVLGSWKFQNAVGAERSLHLKHWKYRCRGEWFNMPEDVIASILDYLNQPSPTGD